MIEFGVFWRCASIGVFWCLSVARFWSCDSIDVVLVLEFGVTLERFIS